VESIAFPSQKITREVSLCSSVSLGKDLASLNRNDAGHSPALIPSLAQPLSAPNSKIDLACGEFSPPADRLPPSPALRTSDRVRCSEKRNAVRFAIFSAPRGENIDLMIAVRTVKKPCSRPRRRYRFHLLEHLDGLRASCRETSEGVETTTAPVSGTFCTTTTRYRPSQAADRTII